MNKSIVIITTILSLGTMGCAGVGPQVAGTAARPTGLMSYASGGLGTLWEAGSADPTGLEQRVAYQERGSDLWTPASVVRPSEQDPNKADPKGTFSTTTTKLKF